MCKKVGEAFAKQNHEKDKLTKLLMDFFVQRGRLLKDLIKKSGALVTSLFAQ